MVMGRRPGVYTCLRCNRRLTAAERVVAQVRFLLPDKKHVAKALLVGDYCQGCADTEIKHVERRRQEKTGRGVLSAAS